MAPRARSAILVMALAGLVALAGCAAPEEDPSDPTPEPTQSPPPDGPVATTAVAGCTVENAGSGTVHTVAAWVTFYEDQCADGRVGQEEPVVDFSRQVVVWHAMGRQPTAGYAVELERAQVANGTLHVHFVESVPEDACGEAPPSTHPTGVWIVDAAVSERELSHAQQMRSCG